MSQFVDVAKLIKVTFSASMDRKIGTLEVWG
jgi:hypothetical protein